MTTDINEYTSEKATKTLDILAKNADMLEQTADNLRAAADNIYTTYNSEALGFKIEQDRNTGSCKLMRNGHRIDVRDKSQHQVTDSYSLSTEQARLTAEAVNHVVDTLNNVGYLAHIIHKDHRALTSRETQMLNTLPHTLESAAAIMDSYVKHTPASEEKKASVVQARRDATFMRKLKEELGENLPHVKTYHDAMVDREADLLGVEEIKKSHADKFKKGVELLVESQTIATDKNPSYRERIGKRKPLEVLACDPAECKGAGKELA